MRIVIIEDEKLTAKDLAVTITRLQPDTEIVAMLYSVKECLAFFKNGAPGIDLIFSDIQLGDGLSFDVFSEVTVAAPVIFCTAFDEYALDAFKANGIDYILKPFTEDTIQAALQKYQSLKQRMTVNEPQPFDELLKLFTGKKNEGQGAVLVYDRDKILPVAIADIAFFFLKNGVIHLTTFEKNTYHLNNTLDDLEKLTGSSFFRVNRQYLVSRKAVVNASSYLSRKLSVSLKVPAEDTVLVSKEKMPQFLDWLTIV